MTPLESALDQIDRAFGKGTVPPRTEPRKESRPWWQVGWRVARFHREASRHDPRPRKRSASPYMLSWAGWFRKRVGERRWPDTPF